ncbi:MAG: XTP/dITP diphosphatase [Candidatus Helarchaeota archaeon]
MIYFATRNKGKFKEAKLFLKNKYSIDITQLEDIDIPEIQHDEIEKIAEFSLSYLIEKSKKYQFVEDSGLFIEVLKGFPGPYSSYVYRTIGNEGILNLLKPLNGEKPYKAYFKAIIAFYDPKKDLKILFKGISEGYISNKIKGNKGWGFDPIFIPFNGDGRTFGEMSIELKNKLSHRMDALDKFGSYIKKLKLLS